MFKKIFTYLFNLFFTIEKSHLILNDIEEDYYKKYIENKPYRRDIPNIIKDKFRDKINWKFVHYISDNLLLPHMDVGHNIRMWIYVAENSNGLMSKRKDFLHEILTMQYIYCTSDNKYGSGLKIDIIELMEKFYNDNGFFYDIEIFSYEDNLKELKWIINDVQTKIKSKYNIEIIENCPSIHTDSISYVLKFKLLD